jgi:hypothetical protein
MMNNVARALALAVLLVWTAVAPRIAQAQSSLPESGFAVGTAFPTISLPSLEDGRPMSIADFRGKKVILHIFASW